MKNLRISIITPSLNQGQYIEDCIKSVLNQNYGNYEHIVIDGGSDDNTIEILKKYNKDLIWISEPDGGQSHALNKALSMATGEIIGWINADDYYCENIFEEVASYFENERVKWIIGQLYAQYEDSKIIVPSKGDKTCYGKLLKKDSKLMRTPAAFFRNKLIRKIGGFDRNLHYIMDYDAWVKMAKLSNPLNVSSYISVFRIHSEQKTNLNNFFKKSKEVKVVALRHSAYLYLVNFLFASFKSYIRRIVKRRLINIGIIDRKYYDVPYSTRKRQ